MKNQICLFLVTIAIIISFTSAIDLKQYNIKKDKITVSGISSGAFMAVQLHVIYSSIFKGVGSFAGGPFYCAKGALTTATLSCMYGIQPIDVTSLVYRARDYQSKNLIDPVENLENSQAWIFSGTQDSVVKQTVSKSLEEFYGKVHSNVSSIFDIPAQHAWVTDMYGNSCSMLMSPYINNCGINSIEKMLTHVLKTDLNPKGKQDPSSLYEFDQSIFTGEGSEMDSTGYIYIPQKCKSGEKQCYLHFAFHGCSMGKDFIQDTFARESELNEFAETNDIIVVYPQAVKNMWKSNPNGCWDWWGYTDYNYSNNQGKQPLAIRKMVKALSGV